MNATHMWIGGVLAVLVLGGGVYATQKSSQESMVMEKKDLVGTEAPKLQGEAMPEKKDSEAMADKETMMQKEDDAVMVKGSYEVYAPEKLAHAAMGKVVLFFRATWCPSCKTIDTDIRSKLSAIPAGVTILDVDYDTAAALKQKYGVTYQHTFVQVDASGAQITKWSGGATLADLVSHLQ